MPFGEGIIDYGGTLKSLISDKYGGVVSVEPEYEDVNGGSIEAGRQCIFAAK
ncbi:MAG: hypothetical protein JXQ30_03705 [Spirochaetes bacterium]|nr:hypothetical protein [Spirochaetota bacterium]